MTSDSQAVPRGRARRFGKFARLASGVAGSMLAEGVKQVASGRRPKARDLLLTPANASRLTQRLAEMRGAAMKLGQIFSMDTGDFLPRELADILATLRDAAYTMPDSQLDEVLSDAFGADYVKKLKHFETKAIRCRLDWTGASVDHTRWPRGSAEGAIPGCQRKHRLRCG